MRDSAIPLNNNNDNILRPPVRRDDPRAFGEWIIDRAGVQTIRTNHALSHLGLTSHGTGIPC